MGTNHNTIDFSNSYLKDFIVYQDQNLTSTCETYLRTFQFPVFELLLFLQILFPVLYSFMIPCISSFCIECYTGTIQDEEQVHLVWTKTSTILMGSWAHWYFHWEMCSWMWSTLAVIYLSYCPINARYYEFTVGMSLVSVTVSSMSNVLSDYRNNLEPGRLRQALNLAAVLHCSWILRILYPLVWNIQQQLPIEENDNLESGNLEMEGPPSLGPPEYQQAVEEAEDPDVIEEQPPTYNETITRIRQQLPKLSRSISISGQKAGRQLSIKRQKSTSSVAASKQKVNPTQSVEM